MSSDPLHWVDGVGLAAREAPRSVIRGLRAVDPAADLLYLGAGRWLLVVLKPQNRARQQVAYNLLEQLTATVRNTPLAERNMTAIRQRARFAALAYAGYAPVAQYDIIGAPDLSIVQDFARRDWEYRNKNHEQHLNTLLDPQQQQRASAKAELQDHGRHYDAWRYAFTRSHAVTRHDDPIKLGQRVRPGFVRHTIPSTTAAQYDDNMD